MKLGKLLAAGKSIMNGRTDISYRSSKQIYLPKFGSSKNPFKDGASEQDVEKAQPSEPATTVSDPGTSVGGPTRLAPLDEPRAEQASVPHCGIEATAASNRASDRSQEAKPSGNSLSKPQSAMAVVQAASVRQPAPAGESGMRGQRINALSQVVLSPIQRLRSVFSVFRAVLPARKARRSENLAKGQKGTPTQTELSLDAVKVVHNDLSDVDVEVVPIKSRAGAPDLPAPKKSWEFVGERLFGVEAT